MPVIARRGAMPPWEGDRMGSKGLRGGCAGSDGFTVGSDEMAGRGGGGGGGLQLVAAAAIRLDGAVSTSGGGGTGCA